MRTSILACLIAIGHLSLTGQTQISGIINHYATVQQIDFCESELTLTDASAFNAGDHVLLIQMQGASIAVDNSPNFGTVTDWGNAGLFERAEITAVNGNIVVLNHWLTNSYDPEGKTQLVRFPVFDNAIITDTLKAAPWNGSTGGILAFEVLGELTMSAPVDVSGLGFRGGISETITPNNCSWLFAENDYSYESTDWRGARKGEGVAIGIEEMASGRGAAANGGGGGNDHNAGGGGGGHGSAGGLGGENEEPATFGCDGAFPGVGGNATNDFNGERIFFGGGGGAGHSNNDVGTDGGNGGGIVLIKAETISGTSAVINSRGLGSGILAAGDGGGGAGAGGIIWLQVNGIDVDLLLNVSGGDGSDVDNGAGERCFGPGGGGAGGAIYCNQLGISSQLSTALSGGEEGLTTNSTASCNGSSLGAMSGGNGITNTNTILTQGTIVVAPTAIVIQPEEPMLCSNDMAFYQLEAIGLGLSYQWELNDGTGFVPLQEGPLFSGTTSNMLIVDNVDISFSGQLLRCVISSTCKADVVSEEVEIIVEESPVAFFDFTINGLEVQFANQSSGTGNLSWDFGDSQSSTETNPVHTYSGQGIYIVVLMLENSCGTSTFVDTVEFGEAPLASFTFDNSAGCSPITVQFTDQTIEDVTSWSWQFPGGDPGTSAEQHPEIVYSVPGIYDVTLAVTNDFGSNSSTYVDLITVSPIPEAAFDFVVNGLEVSFTNNSQFADDYQWDFGDGSLISSEENPSHLYSTAGSYEVTLTAANPFCDGSITLLVEVGTSATYDWADSRWQIFPNPVASILTIASDQYDGNLEIELFQVNGKLLLRESLSFTKSAPLDMSTLPSGVYFLKLKGGEDVGCIKIVK